MSCVHRYSNTKCVLEVDKLVVSDRKQVFVTHLIPRLLLSDTCYVLSFAIIMLNTSLHNPNVRDKPPVERFISMNRGINEGGDLPEELLRVRIFTIMSACVCARASCVYDD